MKRAGHLRVRSVFLGLAKLRKRGQREDLPRRGPARQSQKRRSRSGESAAAAKSPAGQYPKGHMKACKGRGDLKRTQNFVRETKGGRMGTTEGNYYDWVNGENDDEDGKKMKMESSEVKDERAIKSQVKRKRAL